MSCVVGDAAEIPLVRGDAWSVRPASFSRFVLPFAYSPDASSVPDSGVVYAPAEAPSPARRSYFTPETADVLFGRSRWLELRSENRGPLDPVDFKVHRGTRSWTVRLRPPRLVLFEGPRASGPGSRGSRTGGMATNGDHADVMRTGFLILDACFPVEAESVTLDDLLAFNEAFRYFRRPFDGHETRVQPDGSTYGALLAEAPRDAGAFTRERAAGEPSEGLDLHYLDRWARLLDVPVVIDGARMWLRPAAWAEQARRRSRTASGGGGWLVHSDTRAFVWTCALVRQGWHALQDLAHPAPTRANECGHWVRLLNVDAPGETARHSASCTDFERRWAAERTYNRWEEWGTVYGMNYHGGAMLGPDVVEPPTWRHFEAMYFDQVLLLLYLRTVSFNFSRELGLISSRYRDGEVEFTVFRDRFRELRELFALFTNLYRFPLLSNQQQGIEMYAQARRWLDVDELFGEVKEEISSTHEYLQIDASVKHARNATKASEIAVLALPLVLASGLLGMNVLVEPVEKGLLSWLSWLGLKPEGLRAVVVGVGLLILASVVLLIPTWRWIRAPKTPRAFRWLVGGEHDR